jgi:hypothetical protein
MNICSLFIEFGCIKQPGLANHPVAVSDELEGIRFRGIAEIEIRQRTDDNFLPIPKLFYDQLIGFPDQLDNIVGILFARYFPS